MDVGDTKQCSRCGDIKVKDKFIKNRNICKVCDNKRNRDKYILKKNSSFACSNKQCIKCNQSKCIDSFIIGRNTCKDCFNNERRLKYNSDEDYRKKLIINVTNFKANKIKEREIKKEMELGIDNKKCNFCFEIKHNNEFRINRLKCKNCERDQPLDKFKRTIRARIYFALKKDMKTIEYLGCGTIQYLKWILNNNNNFTLENRGKEWHIDHVIPISKFNLNIKEEQLLAFNWRNTMPLSVKENLSKNNKIIIPQIKEHWKKLLEYHKNENIQMPQIFIDLFARHLDAGNPLEPLTTTLK